MEKINLIFDCDGTILDSYDSIVDTMIKTLVHYGLSVDPSELRRKSLESSVTNVYKSYCEQLGIDYHELRSFSNSLVQNLDLIKPYPYLEELVSNPKFRCFVYTHRGESCGIVLEKYGLKKYFEEIVDSTYGFKIKPDPEGVNYLIKKYKLDINKTYYVGDRLLDIDCGANAGIKTIFFKSSNVKIDCSKANYVVNNLKEINELDI